MVEVGSRKLPYNDISGLEVIFDTVASGCEVGLDIFDPSVVDIGVESVGVVEPLEKLWVRFFVAVDTLLQVDIQSTQGTYHHIGADTLGEWYVTTGEFEFGIRRVIGKCFAYLGSGRGDKGLGIVGKQHDTEQ